MDEAKKCIVFDMDGVIFDSERATLSCWVDVGLEYGISGAAAAEKGVPGVEDTYMKLIGVTKEASRQIMLDTYGQDFDYDEYEAWTIELYRERFSGGRLPMKAGVNELLEWLRDGGWQIGLASSTRREFVVAQLRDAGLLDFFKVVVTGDMIARSKPEPDIYLRACELLGAEPGDAFAIEDSYNGIRSAYAAGMKPLMVPDILGPDDEMRSKAVRIMESLHEVREYLAASCL